MMIFAFLLLFFSPMSRAIVDHVADSDKATLQNNTTLVHIINDTLVHIRALNVSTMGEQDTTLLRCLSCCVHDRPEPYPFDNFSFKKEDVQMLECLSRCSQEKNYTYFRESMRSWALAISVIMLSVPFYFLYVHCRKQRSDRLEADNCLV